MLESIRKHTKWVMGVLFLLIIPSFVLVGIDANYFSGKSEVVARVGRTDITRDQWDNVHRQESDRIRAQSPGIDAKLLDTDQARYATLERMVHDQVLQAAAQKMHLLTSDARLARELHDIPQIAALRRADGTLDADAYRNLVAAQGMTPEGFEARVRHDLSVNQVMGRLVNTGFNSPAEADLAIGALLQRREIQVARFEPASYAAKVSATDTDLQQYYDGHKNQFQQAEQANVEYVVLDLDAIKAGITLNEDDLRTYYKENAQRLAGQEERRASHILITVDKDAPPAEREAAKAKAEKLLEQVRKDPSSFARVAREESQDPGSAVNGGDLGFFGRGAMVKPFEDAVYALKKGEISDLVETDFGYHIIELTDVKAPAVPSFETMRPGLEAELKQQQAQRKFAEMAESFANTVYEQPDNLQAVADKFNLKIHTATGVTRQPQLQAQGVLANPRFLQALFQPESVQSKRNTEAVELDATTMAAGRVIDYQPAMTLPFDQSKDKARQLYLADRSAQLAREDGQAQLAAWKAKPDSAKGLGAKQLVSRDQADNLPPVLVDAVLQAPIDPLPAWLGVDLGQQGYAVVRLERIAPREEQKPEVQRIEQQQYTQAWISAEAMAYYEWLKKQMDVQIKVDKPTALSANDE
ncbi:SurA N-terminal domain-containing protein [Comamonas faecalis]|uniref:Periplasmic chaperone PpiD n=1 Tax=Comamonas faecalis TaxID=1387849 RepID=A0ABP7RQG9_9BURK